MESDAPVQIKQQPELLPFHTKKARGQEDETVNFVLSSGSCTPTTVPCDGSTKIFKLDSKLCGVCGDKALGNNFNAITCESCKAFFRRNALKQKEFTCPFNDNCNVDPITRRFCQKCRLKKCFEIGMKKEWIMTDEEKKLKKRKVEQNRVKRQSSDVPSGPPPSKTLCLSVQKSELENISKHAPPLPSPLTKVIKKSPSIPNADSNVDSTTTETEGISVIQGKVIYHSPSSSNSSSDISSVYTAPASAQMASLHNTQIEAVQLLNQLNENEQFIHNEPTQLWEQESSNHVFPLCDDGENSTAATYSTTTPENRNHAPSLVKETGNRAIHYLNQVRGRNPSPAMLTQYYESPLLSLLIKPGDKDSLPVSDGMQKPSSYGIPYVEPQNPMNYSCDSSNQCKEAQDETLVPLPLNTTDSILSVAIRAEFNSFGMTATPQESMNKELTVAEIAKLQELMMACEALGDPVDQEGPIKLSKNSDPTLINVINLTDIAIRRLIKMSKKISGFKNMCQEDQIALLKGGCTEMMILRSVVTYDPDRDSWNIPHSYGYNIKLGVLKEARGNLYEEHQRFVKSFQPEWRSDENIMILLCAITLFTPERPNVIHKEVVKLEQDSYYYLLKRYLESILNGCEARSTYLLLIRKIAELRILNSTHLRVFLEVNPREVEPLLREVFSMV